MLGRPELRQLNQRITARYNLEPLSRRRPAPISATACRWRDEPGAGGLSRRSGEGNSPLYPRHTRLINVLCDRMMLGAYGRNLGRTDQAMLRLAAREVMGRTPPRRERNRAASGRWPPWVSRWWRWPPPGGGTAGLKPAARRRRPQLLRRPRPGRPGPCSCHHAICGTTIAIPGAGPARAASIAAARPPRRAMRQPSGCFRRRKPLSCCGRSTVRGRCRRACAQMNWPMAWGAWWAMPGPGMNWPSSIAPVT